jgi:cellulose synthase/poly-beta-1,6-N-acetylglucosamine synthase-like glycosyltransferase
MNIIMLIIWIPILAYLTFAVFYHVFLAVAYFVVKEKKHDRPAKLYQYLLFIPAHNEEVIIGRLLESLKQVDYNPGLFKTAVIADNCTDTTTEVVARYNVDVMVRNDPARRGKGLAIEWALQNVNLDKYDAVVIADADNIIDPNFFHGLNEAIDGGSEAIQCNNCLANPSATAFTKIIHLSRTINNELYHHAKHKLGLSSYLMGNGMCFTTGLLKRFGWKAGTIAEDYEYYAKLIKQNEMVGFAANARLYHQESQGIQQATDQRIRWSSGRFQVARTYGWDLLKKGLKEWSYRIIDAAFPLILPNLSLMVEATGVALLVAVLMTIFYPVPFVVYWLVVLIMLEIAYFLLGIYLTKMPLGQFLYAFAFAPVFLVWKGLIDVKGLSGKKIGQWGRAKR